MPTPSSGLPALVASPAARWVDAEYDREERVKVGVDLSVPSHSDIFASAQGRAAANLD